VAITGASNNGVFRWPEAEAALSANFSADALAGLTLPPDDMIGDLHGSAEYRAHLCGVMVKRAVLACG
jgi:carbon-monoxide dehydrogenase medium subunit